MIKKQIISLLAVFLGSAVLCMLTFFLLNYLNFNLWDSLYIIVPVFLIATYLLLHKLQKIVSIWLIFLVLLVGAIGGLYAYSYLRYGAPALPVVLITMAVSIIVPFLVFLGINRTKPKFRSYFIIFIGAVLIDFAVAPLRSGILTVWGVTGSYLSTLVGFWLLFIYSYWMFYKNQKELSVGLIFLSLFLGISILTSPLILYDFESTKGAAFQLPVHWLALIFAFASFKAKKMLKYAIIPCALLIGSWLAVEGYKYYHNKVFEGSYTGEISELAQYPLVFQSAEGDTLSVADFGGKYLLVDHWYTYCGVCYEAFPEVQALYDKYKEHNEVEIITIHSRMENGGGDQKKETTSTGKEILERSGYTLPAYSIDIENPTLKEMGIKGYPTVLIFDKAGQLAFRGNIEFAGRFLEKRLK